LARGQQMSSFPRDSAYARIQARACWRAERCWRAVSPSGCSGSRRPAPVT